MSKDKKKNTLGALLLGTALGAGLGVLFAPKSGKETREDLKNKMDELLEKIKEIDVEEVKKDLEKRFNDLKTELADLDKEKVLAIAKQKGEQIKVKADELVSQAVATSQPHVEQAAQELRKSAIAVTKDVLAKLEKEEA